MSYLFNKIIDDINFGNDDILFGEILINRQDNGRVGITNTYNKILGYNSSHENKLYVYKNNNNHNIIFPSTYITEEDNLTIIDKIRGEKIKLKFGEVYISKLGYKRIGFYNADYMESISSASENTNDITKEFNLGMFGNGTTDWENNVYPIDYKSMDALILNLSENGKYIIANDIMKNYWNQLEYLAIDFGPATTKKRRIILNNTLCDTFKNFISIETSFAFVAYQDGFGATYDINMDLLSTEIKGGDYHQHKMMLFEYVAYKFNYLQINVTDTEIEFKVVL